MHPSSVSSSLQILLLLSIPYPQPPLFPDHFSPISSPFLLPSLSLSSEVKEHHHSDMSDNIPQDTPFFLSPQHVEAHHPMYKSLHDTFPMRSAIAFTQEYVWYWLHRARKLQLALRSSPRLIIWVDWSRASIHAAPGGHLFQTQITYQINGSPVSYPEKFFLLHSSIFFLSHLFNKVNLLHDEHLLPHGASLQYGDFPFTNGMKVRYLVLNCISDPQRLNQEYREFALEEDLPRPLLLQPTPHQFSVNLTPNFTERSPRAVPCNGSLPWPRSPAAPAPTAGRPQGPPNVTVGPPPISPLLAEALNRPVVNPHYFPDFSLFPRPPPLYHQAQLPPLPLTTRVQAPAPGGSSGKKPRRIAPKPRKSEEIDIVTVNVPGTSAQPRPVPASETISLSAGNIEPDTSVSPPRMEEAVPLSAEEEEELGDQFQSLGPYKRRKNNIA